MSNLEFQQEFLSIPENPEIIKVQIIRQYKNLKWYGMNESWGKISAM